MNTNMILILPRDNVVKTFQQVKLVTPRMVCIIHAEVNGSQWEIGGRFRFLFCSPHLISIFIFFPHTFTFQLLDKLWSQVSSLFPPGACL